MRFLLGFLFCCSISYASQDIDAASIAASAQKRADAYLHDAVHLTQNIEQSKSYEEATTMSLDLTNKGQEPIEKHLEKVSQVLVFLSFSMPPQSLEAWLIQCKKAGATPVIRGLINNSFKETFARIQDLSKKTGMGMQLDPILFKTFGVESVPAVIYVKEIPQCPSQMDCKPVDFDILYGDVTLDYALEKLKDAGEGAQLDEMLFRLRRGVA